jgi:hypothetical protein
MKAGRMSFPWIQFFEQFRNYAEVGSAEMFEVLTENFSNQTPDEYSVAWSRIWIKYRGRRHKITDGNTSKKYIYWSTASPRAFQASDDIPAELGLTAFFVGTNRNGILHRSFPGGDESGDVETAITMAEAASSAAEQALQDAAYAQETADGKIVSYWQNDPPETASEGDIWFDTDAGYKAYRWTAGQWVAAQDLGIPQAIAAASNAQGTADGKSTVYYQDDMPTGLTASDAGDLWVDTNNNMKVWAWSGENWVVAQDWYTANLAGEAAYSLAQQALANAAGAQETADGKIVTFWQNTPPYNASAGDLWFDIDDGYKVYRCDYKPENEPAVWSVARDTGIAQAIANAATAQGTADAKSTTYYNVLPPGDLGPEDQGDLWIDTDDNNKLYAWTGAAWVLAQDWYSAQEKADTALSTALQALQDAATALAAAEGKIETFWQASAPSSASEGDLWFDTDDGNKVYRYTSGQWVSAQDDAIAAALAAASTAQGTADAKAVIYYQNDPPTGLGTNDQGDIWVDTNDNNKVYAWTGLMWALIQDWYTANQNATLAANAAATALSAAESRIKSYWQASAPSSASEGDLWFDTDDGNKAYRYTSGSWQSAQDSGIATAIASAATAQGTADGKSAVYYRDSAPTGLGAGDQGDLWVDTDDNNKLYVWNGSAWTLAQDWYSANNAAAAAASQAQSALSEAQSRIKSYWQANAPSSASEGDIWFDTDDGNKAYRYTSGSWQSARDSGIASAIASAATAQGTADGKSAVYFQSSAPAGLGSGDQGDLWVDTDDNNKLYAWNGSAWILAQDWYSANSAAANAASQAQSALSAAAAAQSTADGKIKSYWQASAPSSAAEGDIWFDTDDGNKAYRYTSGTWQSAQDSGIAAAIASAATAQGTADGKSAVYYQTSAPTGLGSGDQGDIWIDTDDNNKLYVWNGSAWVIAQDWYSANSAAASAASQAQSALTAAAAAQATADGKIDSYWQASPPSSASEGDLWFDTDDSNKVYRRTSGLWVLARDNGIATAIANAATAQGTADGKNTVYYQASPPTGLGYANDGDMWIDTDANNKLYVWNGTAWVLAQDWYTANATATLAYNAAQSALSAASNAQSTADSKIVSYWQNDPPATANNGDLWFDTNDNNRVYRRTSGSWVDARDSGIAAAISAAATAQGTADSKSVVYYQTSAPTGLGSGDAGDLWIDTDDSAKLYAWTGSAWVLAHDWYRVLAGLNSDGTVGDDNVVQNSIEDNVISADTGDPVSPHFTSFTQNGSWIDLDLSSYLPAGRLTAILRFSGTAKSSISGGVANFYTRTKGNSNDQNMSSVSASQGWTVRTDLIVRADANRKIQYKAYPANCWSGIGLTVGMSLL